MSDKIQARYAQLCLTLGDIEVKKQGLANQRLAVFKQLELLDAEAAKAAQCSESTRSTIDDTDN